MSRDLTADAPAPDNGILQLTRALSKGCELSWTTFYDNYHRRLRGYLSACWKGEPAAIDDLLQETLIRAVKHVRPFSDEATFWSWLTVLARSAVADHGRKRSRFRRFLESFRPEKPAPLPDDEALFIALKKLPEEPQNLLRMKYDERRTVAEIASHLNLSEKAVESRLTRARATLKKIYRP